MSTSVQTAAIPGRLNNMTARQVLWFDETHETEQGYRVNIVTENADGYLPTELRLPTSYGEARAYIEQINLVLLGIDKDTALSIVMSSMFPTTRKPQQASTK
jgi:hypothetical protein